SSWSSKVSSDARLLSPAARSPDSSRARMLWRSPAIFSRFLVFTGWCSGSHLNLRLPISSRYSRTLRSADRTRSTKDSFGTGLIGGEFLSGKLALIVSTPPSDDEVHSNSHASRPLPNRDFGWELAAISA